MRPVKEILRAIEASGRSERQVSIAALGHDSGVSNLKKNGDLRVSTALALCRELGLEFYVGPPRAVPAEITRALELPETCGTMDAVIEIARLARHRK